MKVAVLGAGGMLGRMVLDVLAREKGLEVLASARGRALAGAAKAAYPDVAWRELDAETASVADIGAVIEGADCVVNCIGLIKQRFDDTDASEVERAILVNALFPQRLGRAARVAGARVLQIATDCVYSGARGSYVETDPHDALDVYGKTKSLGECRSGAVSSLRCSIVGPELDGGPSLLEWFLSQPRGARLNGFTNHRWNGVTTLHFAKLCAGIVKSGLKPGSLRHVVPGDSVTKHELLTLFARAYGREDVVIAPVAAPT
ncbi:MAG TPA: sugar nucleotide-binding protein, partial [Elusimicrobiota bacterium]|nr:sugar nucleotide-binding protein [Elusimicrobiota bacterium]